MKNIPITIKEEFVCYIGHKIRTEAAYKYQPVTNQIVAAMAGTEYDANRPITVNIHPDLVLSLMDELGTLGEKYTGSLHLSMKNAMKDSLTATVMAEMAKPEAERDLELLQSIQYLNTKIEERDADIEQWRVDRAVDGRNFFVS